MEAIASTLSAAEGPVDAVGFSMGARVLLGLAASLGDPGVLR